jgi:hypothetical protein
MLLGPVSVRISSPICSSCTRRSPEGVEIFVPFNRQDVLQPIAAEQGPADAEFLANARKGALAAPTAITLNSCRRVPTCRSFFIGRSAVKLKLKLFLNTGNVNTGPYIERSSTGLPSRPGEFHGNRSTSKQLLRTTYPQRAPVLPERRPLGRALRNAIGGGLGVSSGSFVHVGPRLGQGLYRRIDHGRASRDVQGQPLGALPSLRKRPISSSSHPRNLKRAGCREI